MSPVKNLVLSKAAVTAIIAFEVSSKEYYNKECIHPDVPGLGSGITIGIGYDLGYNTPAQVILDWRGHLDEEDLTRLALVAGLKGAEAEAALKRVSDIVVPFSNASEVFLLDVLPRYCRDAMAAYPGLELLKPDAIGAIVSLVYNRGTDLTDDAGDKNKRRKEMAAIKPLIAAKDYNGIAAQIVAMKRLWDGVANYPGAKEKRAKGLLDRRDKEASLVKNAVHQYAETEIVNIPLN